MTPTVVAACTTRIRIAPAAGTVMLSCSTANLAAAVPVPFDVPVATTV